MTAYKDNILRLFDLQKRVEAGMSLLNKNVDVNKECLPYFVTIFKKDPAEARHDWPDFGDLTSRYVEAFIMGRRILGVESLSEVEIRQKKLLLSYFNEGDGLSYRPKPDKPYYSTIFRRYYDGHVAEGFDQARVLWALLVWYEDTGEQSVLKHLTDLIDGLDRVMIKKGDYGYYDRSTFEPGAIVDPQNPPMPHQFYFSGTQIHPLIEIYRRLDIKKAFELADRLSNFIAYNSDYFLPDGQWNCPGGCGFESAEMDGHTHSRFACIAGMTATGMVKGDVKLVVKMKKAYNWFVTNHCSSFGWSPEFLGRFGDENEGCETCAIMDQLNCLFEFIEAGYVEMYEDVEKIARNQLLENQMLDTRLVRNTVETEDTGLSCFHNVADMVRGGFAGWAAPNDFIGNCNHHYCLMGCCGPAGIRAIYDVWNHIYTVKDGNMYVNIYMSRNGDELEINSLQPAAGKLEISVKKEGTLNIADRSWLDAGLVKIEKNGEKTDFNIENGYINIGYVSKGDKITVDYCLDETIEETHVNGRDYKVIWQGDTVVSIDPEGEIMPFYKGRAESSLHRGNIGRHKKYEKEIRLPAYSS